MNETELRVGIDQATLVLGQDRIDSPHGRFEAHLFCDQAQGRTAMAIALGDLGAPMPLLARVHSSCVTSESLMARDCDCAEQLDAALAAIAEAGRGVVFYLMQEGRGAGLTAKARDRMIVQASGHRLTTFDAYAEMGLPSDLRRYDVVGPMARALGIRGPMELMTNNPQKAEAVRLALVDEKIDVRTTLPIQGPFSPFNRDYLRAKRRAGHDLDRGRAMATALPPGSVAVEPPMRAAGRPHLISTACYFLPVGLSPSARRSQSRPRSSRAEAVDWFRMRVVYDLRTARESVLLWSGSPRIACGDVITLSLVDRLPCFQALGRDALRLSLLEIRERGEGNVVVHFDESNLRADPARVDPGEEVPSLAEEMRTAEWLTTTEDGNGRDAEP